MTTMTKREKAQSKIVPGKAYAIDEALQLVRDNAKVKFVESVDVAVRLRVYAKKSDQQVRGPTVLPAGTGTTVRVAVLVPAAAKAEARSEAHRSELPYLMCTSHAVLDRNKNKATTSIL